MWADGGYKVGLVDVNSQPQGYGAYLRSQNMGPIKDPQFIETAMIALYGHTYPLSRSPL